MSTETVTDLKLDTRTELPKKFKCKSQILILSPNLTKLPDWFLYKNRYVKKIDMSKCINITIIPDDFCGRSIIEHIIWPPNIIKIHGDCLKYNTCIQKIDLSYCNKLIAIGFQFCEHTNIVNIILPVSSYCINLKHIESSFCANTNIQYIKFPKSLETINDICYESNTNELDFSECKNLKIHIYEYFKVETLKLYSIDNIITMCKIQCKNLYIYNIAEYKYLSIAFIYNLQTVHLPEGEYCIKDSQLDLYSNVTFWLRSSAHTAKYFSTLQRYSYLPVLDLVELDILLETV
jgi:hypothetical protein